MKRAVLPALLFAACAVQEIPRVQWPLLGAYRPTKPALVETAGGLFYVTNKTEITFVKRDGREITRRWQEIALAKNAFTAISVAREVFTFGLAELEKVLVHGKPVGELTGVVPDQRQGPAGPGPAGRPMF